MSARQVTVLLRGPVVCAAGVSCGAPRSRCGDEEYGSSIEIVLPRRGVFQLHRAGEVITAEPGTALLVGGGDVPHRVSHPGQAGDDCTVLTAAPHVIEDALGDARSRAARISAATQVAIATLTARLSNGAASRRASPSARPSAVEHLAAEEAAVQLLAVVSGEFAGAPAPLGGALQRRRVADVRALLAAEPTAPWRRETIAAAVHCSPFHLARQFRTITGETIARYVLRLRLSLALERVTQGERDLAQLAAELGFSGHSHMTARFTSTFGVAPSEMRKIVTARPT